MSFDAKVQRVKERKEEEEKAFFFSLLLRLLCALYVKFDDL